MTAKERYHSDDEYRERRLAISKRYYQTHRESVIANVQRWHEKHPPKVAYALRKTNGQFSELV